MDEDCAVCWICLGTSEDKYSKRGELVQVCGCPRDVHRYCLARWQLQRAGTRDEKKCRFCEEDLPDWREGLPALPRANPVMVLTYGGQSYALPVEEKESGGPHEFEERVKKLIGLPEDVVLNLTFGCKVPGTDDDIVLEGAAAFEAAVTCAAVSAGLRQQRLESSRATTMSVTPRTCSSQLGQLGARVSRMIAPFTERAVEQDSQCGLQSDWP